MNKPLASLALCLLFVPAMQAADSSAGKQVFERYCANCHAAGVGHPGTQMLGWLKGDKMAVLERRSDLAPAYVQWVVRQGLAEMAPFRPSEINDAALADLTAYLARNNPDATGASARKRRQL